MSGYTDVNAVNYRSGLSYNVQYQGDFYGRGQPQQRGYPPRQDYPPQRRSSQQSQPQSDRNKSRRRKGGRGLGIVLRVLIIIIFIAILIIPSLRDQFFLYLEAGLDHYNEIPASAEFILERKLSIESDEPIDYTLYIPKPGDVEIDEIMVQEVVSIETTPRYTQGTGDFKDRMVWQGHLNPGGSEEIVITYEMKTKSIEWDNIGYKSSGTIGDIPNRIQDGHDKSLFLNDAWPVKDYNDDPGVDSDGDGILDERDVDDDNDGRVDKYRIEPSNPEIQNLLDEILSWAGISNSGPSPDLNVWHVTNAIYQYLRSSDDKVKYPSEEEAYYDNVAYGGNPKWATGCFDDRRGDCDDQSILYISLCRAAGIPGWLEIGALYNYWTFEWEGHGWANIYIPLDDGGFNTPMIDVVNSLYLVRDPNRFSEWTDDGIPGRFGTGADQFDWEPSSLEQHYIAWQYTYTGSAPSISTGEDFKSLFWEAHPSSKVYF